MKIRALSFLLIYMLTVTSVLTACTPTQQNIDTDVGKKEKLTNVFKLNWLSLPDEYAEVLPDTNVFFNDRIYTMAREMTDDPFGSSPPVIVSYDMDGGDMQVETLPYDDVDRFIFLSDSSRVFLLYLYDSDNNVGEYLLKKVDTSGNEVFSVNLTDTFPPLPTGVTDNYITGFEVDTENRIYIQINASVMVFSPDNGQKLFQLTPAEVSIKDMLPINGRIAIFWSDTGSENFKYINAEDGDLGERVHIPKGISFDRFTTSLSPAYGEEDSEVLYYYQTNTGMYSVSEGQENEVEVVNWTNSDIYSSTTRKAKMIGSDKLLYAVYDFSSGEKGIALMNRVPEDEVAPKHVIEFGFVDYGYLRIDIVDMVMKFNKENEDYKIKLINYYDDFGGTSRGEDLTLYINSQFAVGKIPDMFMFDQISITGREYEDKGLFYDLYEYMESDSELNRDDFIKSILRMGEVNGKLYYLPRDCKIRTVAGKSENVADMKGWSVSEFLDIAENLDDGVKIIRYQDRDSVYRQLIKPGLSTFIDTESKTCSFDSDVFLRLLSYIETFPDISATFYSDDMIKNELLENISLVQDEHITNFVDYAKLKERYGTEELTMVGYPGGSEKIEVSTSFAISAQSEKEKRDGAWEFIKYMYKSHEPSSGTILGFPAKRTAFEKLGESYIKNYSPEAWEEKATIFSMDQVAKDRLGTPVIVVREDIDRALAYIESIEAEPYVSPAVYDILDEEMSYFIAGVKSAADTAKIIQGRVSIMLSE